MRHSDLITIAGGDIKPEIIGDKEDDVWRDFCILNGAIGNQKYRESGGKRFQSGHSGQMLQRRVETCR